MENNTVTKICPICQKEVKNIKLHHWRAHGLGVLHDPKSGKPGGNQFTKAKSLGLPPPKSGNKGKEGTFKGKKHSEETKNKIRESRIKFLEENPDKVPYKLNHYSKGRSYAEEYWKNVLEANDIEFVEQYPINLYSLDFAILSKKIDLEIDGDQHYLDPRIVESDKKRDYFLSEMGWKIIRVKWSFYKKLDNKAEFVYSLIQQLK